MKKIIMVLMVFILSLSVMACGGSEGQTKGETYIAVTEPTFAPFDSTDEDGNIIGFDMDLMNAIGKNQGFKVEYKAVEFDALIPAVQSGNADMITAGYNAMDKNRQKKVDFSDTYYDSGLVVMVKQDNDNIKGIDSLTKNMKVTSQTGTTGADLAIKLDKEGQIKEAVILNGFDTAILQLQNGDVDAVIIDKPVAENYIKKQPGEIKIVGETLNAESYGFAVNKGNTELLNKINDGLRNVIESGEYEEICKKWSIEGVY
ncbi:MAG: basic amino acid ABC transporter substrate-binding protein [Eubacteriales bacterium]|nr:basic amino acid ABC transporter substrate-binding protein [Eubacteriales bacterium]